MSFIPPKFQCDKCGVIEVAEWTGEPNWDVPKGWGYRYGLKKEATYTIVGGVVEHSCKQCKIIAAEASLIGL